MPTESNHHTPEIAPEAKPAGTSRRGALGAALAGAGALGALGALAGCSSNSSAQTSASASSTAVKIPTRFTGSIRAASLLRFRTACTLRR